jgi:DNA-binding SARP family transcriptional activator
MDQGVNVFHVTKRRLHKTLDMDVLVHDDNYYRINPDFSVQMDTTRFVSALIEGRNETNPKKRMAALLKASELYKGPFLQGHMDEWILQRRADFQAGYLEALTEMAHIRMEEERYEYALGLFQRAIAEDFSRENIHREIMELYAKLGRRSEVAAHYQRLNEEFRKSGRLPNLETQEIYEKLMA